MKRTVNLESLSKRKQKQIRDKKILDDFFRNGLKITYKYYDKAGKYHSTPFADDNNIVNDQTTSSQSQSLSNTSLELSNEHNCAEIIDMQDISNCPSVCSNLESPTNQFENINKVLSESAQEYNISISNEVDVLKDMYEVTNEEKNFIDSFRSAELCAVQFLNSVTTNPDANDHNNVEDEQDIESITLEDIQNFLKNIENHSDTMNNNSATGNENSPELLRDTKFYFVQKPVESETTNISKISPLKMKINFDHEQNLSQIDFTNSVFFNFVKKQIDSIDSNIHEEPFCEKAYKQFTVDHFTTHQISTSLKFTLDVIKLLPNYEQNLEHLKDFKALITCDGKKLINDCKRSSYNKSILWYIEICIEKKTIFNIIKGIDFKNEIVSNHYRAFMNKNTNSNTTSTDQMNNFLDISSNSIMLPEINDNLKKKCKNLRTDICLLPYSSLIMYIQQILLYKGCIDKFKHSSKAEVLSLIKKCTRIQNQGELLKLLYENKIGLHDLQKMIDIRNVDFDYCVSLSVHSDGAGTNSTFKTFSAASTYIIQVQLLNVEMIHDNLFTHIVFSWYTEFQHTAYNMLMKEIKFLESGCRLKVNTGKIIEEKKFIFYVDSCKGDYKEVTDLLGICSSASKMPYIWDFTLMKDYSEIYFILSHMVPGSKYYEQARIESEGGVVTHFNLYDINDNVLTEIRTTSVVYHYPTRAYLYRTYQAVQNRIQCKLRNNVRLNTSIKDSLLRDYFKENIFYVLSTDMFHSIFNQCKRYYEILLNSESIQSLLNKEIQIVQNYPKPDVFQGCFHSNTGNKYYFTFQLRPESLQQLISNLSNLHSPFFGSKIDKDMFCDTSFKSMSITDLIHVFAVIIPLCFDTMTMKECYLKHPLLLFSTIIELTFDTTIDINDSNVEMYKLHYKISVSCANSERYIKTYKGGIHQSPNTNTTATNNQNDREQSLIYMFLNENNNDQNKPYLSFIINPKKDSVLWNQIYEDLLRTPNNEVVLSQTNNQKDKLHFYYIFSYNDVSFVSYRKIGDRHDNCMIRLKNRENGVLFGRLQYVIQIEDSKDIYFKFDTIYVTMKKVDSCIYTDNFLLPDNFDPDTLPYLVKMDSIDILPVAYITYKCFCERSENNQYYRLCLYKTIDFTSFNIKTKILSYDITSFHIDSISNFD